MDAPPKDNKPHQSAGSAKELSISSPKRSRVVVSQSKGGCATCKLRRVKCDEQKWMCLRCIRAGILCAGYGDAGNSPYTLQPALTTGVRVDVNTERLSSLAAHVLSLDDNGYSLQENDVWGRVFLQLSNQVECVKAAAAAFGAAYEVWLTNAASEGRHSAWRYYGSALTKFKSDLDNETVGAEPLVLVSMILACVELLGQNEQNAFAHFLGAVRILTKTYQSRQGTPSTSNDILSTVKDSLVTANLLVGSYTLSETPQAMYFDPSPEADLGEDAFHKPELAIKVSTLCLSGAYKFLDSVGRIRYAYPSWKDCDPIKRKGQSDAAAECLSTLHGLTELTTRLEIQYSSTKPTLQETETLAEFYSIRTQLASTLIFVLCAHDPYETAYDQYLGRFRSIVSDAAASTRLRRRVKPSALKRFSTRPGIVSPLFFVSMRCRDPQLRALASAMLGEQGREGPADGPTLAAVGARLAVLETPARDPASLGAPLAACQVLQEKRVHGYVIASPKLNSETSRVVNVVLSKPNPPVAEGWGRVDYTCPSAWMYWTEHIEL